MANNGLIVRDQNGNAVTLASTDVGSSVQAMRHQICDATAAHFLPSADAVARSLFAAIGDGTTTVTVKAASTLAQITDTSLVVQPLQATDGTHTEPIGDAYARAMFVSLGAEAVKAGATAAANCVLQGAEFLANASLLALTTGQQGPLQCDPSGTLKVGSAVLGTPVYGSASSGGAAAASVTLTIPSAKMGFLDFIDVDGLGATTGAVANLTITGALGGTLTYNIGIAAGVTTPIAPVRLRFNPPIQASATNTNLVCAIASFGTGNTQSSLVAGGHYV